MCYHNYIIPQVASKLKKSHKIINCAAVWPKVGVNLHRI